MKAARPLIAAVVVMVACFVLMVPAVMAAGGHGASFCSNAAGPTAFPADETPPGNPGQITSWIARTFGFSGGDNNPGHFSGSHDSGLPVNADECNPTVGSD